MDRERVSIVEELERDYAGFFGLWVAVRVG